MDTKQIYDVENAESENATLCTDNEDYVSEASAGTSIKNMYCRELDEAKITESPMVLYDAPKIIKVKTYRLYKGQ